MYSVNFMNFMNKSLKSIRITSTAFSLLFFLSTTTIALGDGFDDKNNPDDMRMSNEAPFTKSFDKLKKDGQAKNPGWSDTYWATVRRGAACQWIGEFDITKFVRNKSVESENEFNQRIARVKKVTENLDNLLDLTAKDIFLMPEEERMKLPPTMKLDIVNLDFNYPLTKGQLDSSRDTYEEYTAAEKEYNEAISNNDDDAAKKAKERMSKVSWFGICHGWAPATIMEKEPNKCEMNINCSAGKFNLSVASSDMKALISLLYADYDGNSEEVSCGDRCETYYEKDDKNRLKDKTYTDLNPGAFFIILGNKIGINKKGFVVEITAGAPVWNQGGVKYSHKIKDVNAKAIKKLKVEEKKVAKGTKKQKLVETTLSYITEVSPQIEASGTKDIYKEIHLTYLIELDGKNNVIGGRWVGDSIDDHPDFVWDKAVVDPNNAKAKALFGDGMLEMMKKSGMRK
ncbi:MAG: hypothetical protein HQK49_02135 [Oligoflexia bacterium]|nr:hypothetical protein [Oligoflexia bacterium]